MCGIDGRVAEERPKREVRSADGFRCGSPGVDGDGGFTTGAAAVTSVAAAASTLSKVSVGAFLRSQVGWENDVVLACSVILLSSSGCIA